MQPIVNGLQTAYDGQIAFDAIDAATASGAEALNAYRLRGHPSYVIADTAGAALWSFSGQMTEEQLRTQIETYLTN